MRFVKFKVSNYKSFRESTDLHFAPGINVIVGQNNSGKTALLEAISLTFSDKPHRSLETMPTRTTALEPQSKVNFSFEVGAADLRGLMRNPPGERFVPCRGGQSAAEAPLLSEVLNSSTVEFGATYSPSQITTGVLSAYPPEPRHTIALRCSADTTHVVVDGQVYHTPNPTNTLPYQMANVIRSRIYWFQAERLALSQSPMGPDPTLRSNAGNLAQVLNFLSTDNPPRYERFLSYVRDVFPQIHRITVPPLSTNEARVLVWTQNADLERNDLAIPLNESGTGIGQVLAMLYVLVWSDSPRVILIDEPQSFLHPSAIRKLLEIFAAHPMHQ